VPSSTSACLLVTHSPNAAVLYSVRRIFSRSFNAIIVMQMVICHSHGWQQSALHVTDQPGPRHIAHVVVSTGPRELTEILPVAGQPRSRHIAHVVVSTTQGSSPRPFPRRIMPRRSQAAAGHVVVRHFFHWLGHIT
jgi:hypothetical protein